MLGHFVSSKVSVLWRTYLLVTLFFVSVTVLGLALLVRQASEDVQREVQAAEAVVEYLYEAAQRDPASLQNGLADNLRHVRLQWLPLATDPAAQSFEQWLGQRLFALQHIHEWPRWRTVGNCRSASIPAMKSTKSGIRCCSCCCSACWRC